ncbi:MAG TPA: hypothetical protein VEY96_08840 [Actinomycetes bacterium]|nr:hypothetical protein [Actinomycetes bacterium]
MPQGRPKLRHRAAHIPNLGAFVEALLPVAARLAGPGNCLLLVNTTSELERAVGSAGVPTATLAAEPGSHTGAAT